MSKPHLLITCLAIAIAPPLLLIAMNSQKLLVEDRQSGRLLYFTENS